MQAHEKCTMKIKEIKEINKQRNTKNDACVKDFLMEGRNLYWCYIKLLQHI